MQPILQHLFQVSALEDVSQERLESFVEEHPSFGIGHFLLSHKLKAEGSGRFQEETERTCLYFSNPFWLQWLLENAPAPPTEGPVSVETGWAKEADPETSTDDDLAEALTAGEPEVITAEEFTGTSAGEGETIGDNMELPAEEAVGSEPSAAELLLRSIEEAKEIRGNLDKLNDDFTVETAMAGEGLEEPKVEEPIRDEETPFVLEEASEEPVPAPALSAPPMDAPASESPARQDPAPAVASQDILFEPYHTIDYFASQGIKLSLDENPGDTLGKQLKSFTEWLKSMRRLPQKDREVVPDRVAEEAIQSFAAHSIEGKDVVTETMAEVLAKQGMHERARAVYEKLSLLNPDKRAYFATKIEQLNTL